MDMVTDAIDQHMYEQSTWPAVTDCDLLDRAFAELEGRGILCRQNYCSCPSDGHAELVDEMEIARKAGRDVRGYAFFDQQVTDMAIHNGTLCLAFGPGPATDEEISAIARVLLPEWRDKMDAAATTFVPADHVGPRGPAKWLRGRWVRMLLPTSRPSRMKSTLEQIRQTVKKDLKANRFAAITKSSATIEVISKLGREILETLRRHGLDARWNGSILECIQIEMDWKRRR